MYVHDIDDIYVHLIVDREYYSSESLRSYEATKTVAKKAQKKF